MSQDNMLSLLQNLNGWAKLSFPKVSVEQRRRIICEEVAKAMVSRVDFDTLTKAMISRLGN